MNETSTTASQHRGWCGDLRVAFARELGNALSNPFYLVGMLMQPVLYLFFFAPVLTGLDQLGQSAVGGAYGIFIPALLIQLVLFGGAFSGIALVTEWRSGALERLFATPASRSSLLAGKLTRDVCAGLVVALLVVALSLILGYHMPLPGLLACLALVALTNFSMSALSYMVAVLTKKEDSLAAMVNALLLPLVLIAGIMVPISFAPEWLRVLAHVNPLYYIVEAARAASSCNYGLALWVGIGVGVALAVTSFALAARAFGRRP